MFLVLLYEIALKFHVSDVELNIFGCLHYRNKVCEVV